MGRADFGIKAAAGVEIMIDPTRTRVLERTRLIDAEQSDRQAKFEIGKLRANLFTRPRQMFHLARAGTAHTADHAVAARSALPRAGGALYQLVDGLHLVDRNSGARDPRLRAITAVLRTDPALGIAQDADFDTASVCGFAHLQRRGQQIRQVLF